MKLKATNKKRGVAFLAFLICFLLFSLIGSKSVTAEAQPLTPDVEVVAGYHNYIKYGSYVPVEVRIAGNHAQTGGRVELLVAFQETEQYCYTAEYPSGSEEASVSFCVAMPEYYESDARMEVKILDENGEEIYQSRVGYLGNDQGPQIYVGVLTDQYEGMDYWEELQLGDPYPMGARAIPLSPEAIPGESQKLDMLDLILVKDFTAASLEESQRQAIKEWIFHGGVLLLDGADGMFEGAFEDESTRSYPFVKLDRNGGALYVTEYGTGRIARTDFDTGEFSHIIRNGGEGADTSLYSMLSPEELMECIMGEACLLEIYQNGYRGRWQTQELIQHTSSAEGLRVPSLWVYVLILAGYIMIFIPGCYLALRKKGRLEWVRLALFLLGVVGSGVIFLTGKQTRLSDPFLHYLEVDEYRQGQRTRTVYAALQAPYNTSYEASFDPSYQIIPVIDQWKTETEREKMEEITVGDGEYRIRFSGAKAFQEEHFRLKKAETAEPEVEAEVHLFDGKTTGTLENQTASALEDVMLLMPEYALAVGTLEAGESRDLEDTAAAAVSYDSGNLEDMWGFAADTGHLGAVGRKRRTLIENYMRTCSERTPCVIGFVSDPEAEIQENRAYEQYGEQMVVVYLDVDTTEGEWEYYPAAPMESRVVAGNVYGIHHSEMEGDSSVLAYLLDGEYEIRELTFHMAGNVQGAEAQVTEIYFLNPLTGEYALVYPGDSSFTGEELLNYINMNEIYVKFRSAAEDGVISRLPRISMIGRKRDVGD